MPNLRAEVVSTLLDMLKDPLTPGERFYRTLHYACVFFATDVGVFVPCHSRYPHLQPIPYGFAPEEWQTPRFAFIRSLVIQTCQTPVAILTSDAQPNHHHDIARSIGLHSILCAPLLNQGPPHGMLCLQRRLTATPFVPDDLDILETIAHLATPE